MIPPHFLGVGAHAGMRSSSGVDDATSTAMSAIALLTSGIASTLCNLIIAAASCRYRPAALPDRTLPYQTVIS